MKQTFEWLWLMAASAFGLALFAVLLWWVAKAHARMWQRVAALYRQGARQSTGATRLETIVIAQRAAPGSRMASGQFRQYAGTLLSVGEKGLRASLIPIPPLNLLAPALFLPFDQMTLSPTDWALWPEPFALRMTNTPDIDIILDRETVAWIRAQTDHAPFGWDV